MTKEIYKGFKLNETSRQALRNAKSSVKQMLMERNELDSIKKDSALPSDYWTDFCSFFSYMLDLSEDSLAKIQLHTYHLTGEGYLEYYFSEGTHPAITTFSSLTKDVPEEYIATLPEGSIGFKTKEGKLVTTDLNRAQLAINAFLGAGFDPLVAKKKPRNIFLEIGAGYGSSAYHLSQVYENTTYVIVDLPETLIFSACYLSMFNPERTWVYSPEKSLEEIANPEEIGKYDFILVPNYKLDALRDLRFDAAINVASFQEMRSDQVEVYLDFIIETCTGFLYSYNQEHQQLNSEVSNVTNALSARFDLNEVDLPPSWQIELTPRARIVTQLKKLAYALGIKKKPEEYLPYRPYICWPREVVEK